MLADGPVPPLAPANQTNVLSNWSLIVKCPARVTLRLDPGNKQAEHDEKDNQWSHDFCAGLQIRLK